MLYSSHHYKSYLYIFIVGSWLLVHEVKVQQFLNSRIKIHFKSSLLWHPFFWRSHITAGRTWLIWQASTTVTQAELLFTRWQWRREAPTSGRMEPQPGSARLAGGRRGGRATLDRSRKHRHCHSERKRAEWQQASKLTNCNWGKTHDCYKHTATRALLKL